MFPAEATECAEVTVAVERLYEVARSIGEDEAMLAGAVLGEVTRIAGKLPRHLRRALFDEECLWDIWTRAWEVYTRGYEPGKGAPSTYAHYSVLSALQVTFPFYATGRIYGSTLQHRSRAQVGSLDGVGDGADDAEGQAECALRCDEHEKMREALDYLDERERRLILARFWEGLTLREMGGREGLSHERARQIIRDALVKLRTALS